MWTHERLLGPRRDCSHFPMEIVRSPIRKVENELRVMNWLVAPKQFHHFTFLIHSLVLLLFTAGGSDDFNGRHAWIGCAKN